MVTLDLHLLSESLLLPRAQCIQDVPQHFGIISFCRSFSVLKLSLQIETVMGGVVCVEGCVCLMLFSLQFYFDHFTDEV